MLRFTYLFITAALCHGFANADDTQLVPPDPLFASNDTLAVTMTAAFGSISQDPASQDEIPGKIKYAETDGRIVELDLALRARGHFRRRSEVCRFPPLRLNLKKSQVPGTMFAGQDKLKLVTHCQPRSFVYEQAVVSEYLAYRMLNLMTDISFRVRLLRVNYVDTSGEPELSTLAFLIEDKDRLGERIGQPLVEVESTTLDQVNAEHLNLTSVFQLLIGNTDFSPISGPDGDRCCHNYTLFGDASGPYFSVPYDFDMTGIAAPPHANPNPKMRLESIKERLYRGRCVNNGLLDTSVQAFNDKREAIESLIRAQEELALTTRSDMLRYVNRFFRMIASNRSIKRHLVNKCE